VVVAGSIVLGQSLALAAAFTWSLAVILFKRSDSVGAAAMNLFKNVVALGLLALTLIAMGDTIDLSRSQEDWAALIVSGVVGIAIGDTLEFEALRRVGAGMLAIINLSYAPIIVALSFVFLGESLNVAFAVGAVLVIAGVAVAITGKRQVVIADRSQLASGVALGTGAMVCMGISVILAKPVLEKSGLIEITIVRLAAGVAAQSAVLVLYPAGRRVFAVFKPSATWRTLLPAAVLGCYLAMVLWLGGFKHTDASIAAVLNQLSTIFTIVLARLMLAETFTRRQAWGAALAFSGAILILLL